MRPKPPYPDPTIEEAQILVAELIAAGHEIFLPIFKRLGDELEKQSAKENLLAKAHHLARQKKPDPGKPIGLLCQAWPCAIPLPHIAVAHEVGLDTIWRFYRCETILETMAERIDAMVGRWPQIACLQEFVDDLA